MASLLLGSRGPEVSEWQACLVSNGYLDDNFDRIQIDGSFGPRTRQATLRFQRAMSLDPDGIVGPKTLLAKLEFSGGKPIYLTNDIPFVAAKNFTPTNRTTIDVIVIHDMEYPERPNSAEWCADFFAGKGGLSAPMASAHYCVDSNSAVQCVRDEDIAWHAPGANHNGIGIEHAGYAAQSRSEWLDAYSLAEIRLSSQLVRRLCARWDIPMERLNARDLQDQRRGICGHNDVTLAFPGPGRTHWDPGKAFPWDTYLDLVRKS
jgi:hypothetical protein